MLMNYHIGRLVLSSLCAGAFVAGGFWWCSFCRLKLQPAGNCFQLLMILFTKETYQYLFFFPSSNF